MAGTISQAPQVIQNEDGGIALSWSANIPQGETVQYYSVNIYNASTNTLINTVKLFPATAPIGAAIWDVSTWDIGEWS